MVADETTLGKDERKVAWVTGASSGIGRATTLRLAGKGWVVFASARSADKLYELARLALQHSGTIRALPLDVTDQQASHQAVADILHQTGRLDLALFCAGTHKPFAAQNFDATKLRELVDVNLTSVGYGLEAVLPIFLERRRGQVAVVSSVAGYRGLPTAAAYGATKAALINLCEALYLDLRGSGVDIKLISPGFVRTPLTDLNRFRMPFLISTEEAAKRIVAGLKSKHFEIAFPRRFVWQLKLLRCLPYRLYFPLVSKFTGQ